MNLVSKIAAMSAFVSSSPDVSNGPSYEEIDKILRDGSKRECGWTLGCGHQDGEVFTDSRGRKYVYKKGTIRRVRD